jgi:hypothetical protein
MQDIKFHSNKGFAGQFIKKIPDFILTELPQQNTLAAELLI